VVIVNSDIIRYSGTELYLPLLVEKLNDIWILDDDIEILIAHGIHRKQTVQEHEKIVGPIPGKLQVLHHPSSQLGHHPYSFPFAFIGPQAVITVQ
jgi:lactate racemase